MIEVPVVVTAVSGVALTSIVLAFVYFAFVLEADETVEPTADAGAAVADD